MSWKFSEPDQILNDLKKLSIAISVFADREIANTQELCIN